MSARYAYAIVEPAANVVLLTPYDQAFAEAVKAEIPSAYRAWLPHQRAWVVREPYATAARALAAEHYDHVIVAYTDGPPPAAAETPAGPPAHTLADCEAVVAAVHGPRPDAHRPGDCLAVCATTYPHHRALGVWPGVPRPLLEAAYRACARHYHPDSTQLADRAGAQARMVEVNAAYAVLKEAR